MKVISDYDYITNVIDYDYEYIASESHDYDYDYDYLRSCNRLQSITITDYDYPMPGPGALSPDGGRQSPIARHVLGCSLSSWYNGKSVHLIDRKHCMIHADAQHFRRHPV